MAIFLRKTLILLIPFVLATRIPDDSRNAKVLNYRQNNEDLNIDHIISLWNKSVSDETTQRVETTALPVSEKPVRDTFADRLTYCVKKQKYSAKGYPDQGTILKCLKSELVLKLHTLLANPSETIKLFNGYLEFQKLDQPQIMENEVSKNESIEPEPIKKRYSSRVSSKKPLESEDSSSQSLVPVVLKKPKVSHSHGNDYYEAYQKMLRELVARKNGAELHREKRDERVNTGTLEKSAKLFENGRKLFSEIDNNLENGEEEVETLTKTILDPDLVSSINNLTKTYSLRLNFYPGISARMKRNENSGVTFDLEIDELADSEVNTAQSDDGGRGGKKKKKKPISKKTLKKLFPYLLIPFMIQAALLPIVLKFLLFVAIKALIAGKLALILVAFNAIRNASLKSDEDEYVERMSYDHYGYGQGEEYGAWINKRAYSVPQSSESDEEFVEPYSAYRPVFKEQ